MVNIDCNYLTRLLSQKMRLTFLLEAPLGLYEFDLVKSLQKLQMVKLGRKKYNRRHLRCLSPVSRTRCWFKGKTFELSDGKRTQVFFFSRKKKAWQKSEWRTVSYGECQMEKKCWLAFMLFLMLRTYLLNAGRKEKNIESNIAFWR